MADDPTGKTKRERTQEELVRRFEKRRAARSVTPQAPASASARRAARGHRTYSAPARDPIGALLGRVGPLVIILVWIAASLAATRVGSLEPVRVGPDAIEWMRPTVAGSLALWFRFTVAPALVALAVTLYVLWRRQPGRYRRLTREQYIAAMHATNIRYCEQRGIPLSQAPPIPEYPGPSTDLPRMPSARKHTPLVVSIGVLALVVTVLSIATPTASAPEWRLSRQGIWTHAFEVPWANIRAIEIRHSVGTSTRSSGFGAVRTDQTSVEHRSLSVLLTDGHARNLDWADDRNDEHVLPGAVRWPQRRWWATALKQYAPHVQLVYQGDGSGDGEPNGRVVVYGPNEGKRRSAP